MLDCSVFLNGIALEEVEKRGVKTTTLQEMGRGLILLSWKVDRESTSFARSAVNRYMAAVSLYNVFDNGKAEACAALFPAPGFVNPVKPFKKTGLILF